MKIMFENVGRSHATWISEYPREVPLEDICCDEKWWVRQLRGKMMSEPDWCYNEKERCVDMSLWGQYADRIEAAWKRESEDMELRVTRITREECRAEYRNSVGNAAAMREALKAVKDGIETDVLLPYGELATEGKYVLAAEINKKVLSALSAPLRNCDVGTAEEQIQRFNDYCNAHYSIKCNEPECGACPLWTSGLCGDDCQFK